MSDNKIKSNKVMEVVFDFNTKEENDDYDNEYMSIEFAVKNWECLYLGDLDYSEQYIVNALYTIYQDEWNGGQRRGKNFLEESESKCHLNCKLINNIEKAYDECLKNNDWDIHKNRLEDKLDLLFYLHAENTFKEILNFHNLDLDYFGE